MLEYIFKSAISLALLYSLFFAFLGKETFHRFNRACLLFIMLLSLVLPVMHFTVSKPTMINEVVTVPAAYLMDAPIAVASAEAISSLTWGELLTYIYWAGVGVMIFILLIQTIRMCRLLRGGLRHTDNRGNTIILKKSIKSPFSIFRWIVMDVEDYEQHRQNILIHEQEHIRLGHTYDLLLLEAMHLFQWFNPFIWFLSHDLRTLHEYQADEAVIRQGIDAKQYQQLLVLKAVGNRLQPFANNLRRGSLKQRIAMMYQQKSNRWRMLKALFVIPTMGFALYAFASPEAVPDMKGILNQEVNESSGSKPLNELTSDSIDTDAVFIIDGKLASQKVLQELNPKSIDNVNVLKGDAAKRELFKDLKIDFPDRPISNIIVVQTKAYTEEVESDTVVIYDNKKISLAEYRKIPKEEILWQFTLDGDIAMQQYGAKYAIICESPVKPGEHVTGYIISNEGNKENLSGVQVSEVNSSGKVVGSTLSDMNGKYVLKVNDPKNHVKFEKDGFESVEIGAFVQNVTVELHPLKETAKK